ncbi:MAG: hypothetical protein NT062_17660, partial [Proteobacteria bacterium]|nr:hypothetical protein [Pseudomonadota bacterium]
MISTMRLVPLIRGVEVGPVLQHQLVQRRIGCSTRRRRRHPTGQQRPGGARERDDLNPRAGRAPEVRAHGIALRLELVVRHRSRGVDDQHGREVVRDVGEHVREVDLDADDAVVAERDALTGDLDPRPAPLRDVRGCEPDLMRDVLAPDAAGVVDEALVRQPLGRHGPGDRLPVPGHRDVADLAEKAGRRRQLEIDHERACAWGQDRDVHAARRRGDQHGRGLRAGGDRLGGERVVPAPDLRRVEEGHRIGDPAERRAGPGHDRPAGELEVRVA